MRPLCKRLFKSSFVYQVLWGFTNHSFSQQTMTEHLYVPGAVWGWEESLAPWSSLIHCRKCGKRSGIKGKGNKPSVIMSARTWPSVPLGCWLCFFFFFKNNKYLLLKNFRGCPISANSSVSWTFYGYLQLQSFSAMSLKHLKCLEHQNTYLKHTILLR